MKITILVLATIFGAVLARPEAPLPGRTIPILTFSETKDDAGQYNYVYSTGNGISAAERGSLKPNAARTDNIITKEGSYAFVAPDGITYTTIYKADENGFQVRGAHLHEDLQQ